MIQHILPKIDFDKLLSLVLNRGSKIAIVLLIYYILKRAGNFFISKSFKNYVKRSKSEAGRLVTIEKLIINIYDYSLFFFIVYSILSIFGVPVGSLLAGAGIIGVAIGLGAQGFINDFITGFFITLERQIEVGDYVTINNLEGTVQVVGLRTTQIKSPDGTLNFIPNRTITVIKNASRENMRALIDIRIDPTKIDIQKATDILETTTQKYYRDYPEITTTPTVIGLTQLSNNQYVLRVQMYTENGKQSSIKDTFLNIYLEALKKANIPVEPSPNYVLPQTK